MSIASEPVKECRLGADQRGKTPPETHKSHKGNGRAALHRTQGGETGRTEKDGERQLSFSVFSASRSQKESHKSTKGVKGIFF